MGEGGHNRPEWAAAINRNKRPASTGTGGQDERNTHQIGERMKPLTLPIHRPAIQLHVIVAMALLGGLAVAEDVLELVLAPAHQVREAIERGTDFTTRDDSVQSLLMIASGGNPDEEVIKLLLEAGTDPNARDFQGSTPLHRAALYNSNSAIIPILVAAGAKVEARESIGGRDMGWTPLMAAAFANEPQVVAALLEEGASPNATERVYGRSALIIAARSTEHPEVIDVLLDGGAIGTMTDSFATTAVDYAAENEALVGTKQYWRLNDASY